MSFDTALHSPAVRIAIGVIGAGLVYVLLLEVKKIPAKLFALMATAFIDMVGLLVVIPLLPFYARSLGRNGIDLRLGGSSFHVGIGLIVAMLVSAFTVAQLLSAPAWGRFSDRWGRRPALLVALTASAAAYVVFAFANSLWLLFLSRVVQGAGGGTVGVIQAYVADATEPQNRARSLGWLSAATNLGVALGPVLGAFAVAIGEKHVQMGGMTMHLGGSAPGLVAALLCVINIGFAWRYLPESREPHDGTVHRAPRASREAVLRVIEHSGEPASRLIWIYAIAMGAFQGVTAILALFLADRFQVNEKTISFFFVYIGSISVFTRVLLLGKAVDRFGEARLSRVGTLLLAVGLATIPLASNIAWLALAVALIPLGTAFTFPCVTALLSRVIASHERGLYMGVQQTFGGAARVVAPLWTGFAFDRLGRGVPFFTAAAFVVATIALGLGLDEYAKGKPAMAASGSAERGSDGTAPPAVIGERRPGEKVAK